MIRAALAGVALLATLANPRERAIDYLWNQQASDGGWHSKKYGLLRSGQSLTPFVLLALLDADARAPKERVERALGFIRRHVNGKGALGLADAMSPDYPNYATALGAMALIRTGYREQASPMIAHLRRQQFSEANGWDEKHPAYGGWGMGGDMRTPPDPGHVDLSMTRYVLQALAAAGMEPDDPAMARAAVFLKRCQNPDGGFFFSPVEPEINKAGDAVSYGSPTADGILALRAIGQRSEAAEAWLLENHLKETTPGFTMPSRMAWAEGLRFYYAATARQANPALAIQLPDQARDGSFTNHLGLVKEDDPLIATTFAVQALPKSY